MNKKTVSTSLIATCIATYSMGAIAYAATTNVDSLRVGSVGDGGVTFFNGTIVNESTSEPIAIGDDLRVDGRVWRGESAGPDSTPFIINDNAEVAGSLLVEGSDVMDAIEAKASSSDLGNKADADHNHDSRYYTEDETDTLLAQKSSTGHDHDSSYVSKSSPTWNTVTSYLNVGRGDFKPTFGGGGTGSQWEYEGGLFRFTEVNGLIGDKDFAIASVNLPHGSTVTEVQASYQDTTESAGLQIILLRAPHLPTAQEVASFHSIGDTIDGILMADVDEPLATTNGSNYVIDSTTSITDATIDNENNAYYMYAEFEGTAVPSVMLRQVTLTYTTTSPY